MALGGYNLLGIVVVAVLIFCFVLSLYFYSQFFQVVSYKIRIVLKNTVTKGADFKSLYYPLREEVTQTPLYQSLEKVYKREVVKRKNFYFKNVFLLLVERFHRPFYLPFRNKTLEKLVLLRPPTSFYWMTYLTNLIFLWSLAILIVGGQRNQGSEVTVGQAIGWSVLVGMIGGLLTFIVTYFAHRYYAKEVRSVFVQEIQEEQERVFRTAFVGELINLTDEQNANGFNEKESVDTDHENENQNQTQVSIVKKMLNLPSKGWKERDDYRIQKFLTKKPERGDKSVLQLHSKQLNLYEECRALQMMAYYKPKKYV